MLLHASLENISDFVPVSLQHSDKILKSIFALQPALTTELWSTHSAILLARLLIALLREFLQRWWSRRLLTRIFAQICWALRILLVYKQCRALILHTLIVAAIFKLGKSHWFSFRYRNICLLSITGRQHLCACVSNGLLCRAGSIVCDAWDTERLNSVIFVYFDDCCFSCSWFGTLTADS